MEQVPLYRYVKNPKINKNRQEPKIKKKLTKVNNKNKSTNSPVICEVHLTII